MANEHLLSLTVRIQTPARETRLSSKLVTFSAPDAAFAAPIASAL
jgi:hypothetical protein